MTLKHIAERLRIIEGLELWCLRCDRPAADSVIKAPLQALILDIERELMKRGEL